jgi:hypothetical protein
MASLKRQNPLEPHYFRGFQGVKSLLVRPMISQLSYPLAPVTYAYGGPAVKGFMPFQPCPEAQISRSVLIFTL